MGFRCCGLGIWDSRFGRSFELQGNGLEQGLGFRGFYPKLGTLLEADTLGL